MTGTILITGGHGFIGRIIRSKLKGTVLCPTIEELDLTDHTAVQHWFSQHSIDTVIHCALTGREDLFSTDPKYTTDSLWMFRNLWRCRNQFRQLINMGTAYELDLEQDNSLVSEDAVLDHLPMTSYGLAKNLIARIIRETDNFYNLKLFGVFHENESPQRFFKKLLTNQQIVITKDHYMDYIYLEDIVPVIEAIVNNRCVYREINMVYPEKYLLSELAQQFAVVQGLDPSVVKISARSQANLTGQAQRLSDLNLVLTGLTEGFRRYQQ